MSYLLGIVLTHLNAPDQQTSAFIEVLPPADDHLIRRIWIGLAASYPLHSDGNSEVVLCFCILT